MQLLIVLLGVIVIIIGVFKHVTKINIGYQLINVPGYATAVLGLLLLIWGNIW